MQKKKRKEKKRKEKPLQIKVKSIRRRDLLRETTHQLPDWNISPSLVLVLGLSVFTEPRRWFNTAECNMCGWGYATSFVTPTAVLWPKTGLKQGRSHIRCLQMMKRPVQEVKNNLMYKSSCSRFLCKCFSFSCNILFFPAPNHYDRLILSCSCCGLAGSLSVCRVKKWLLSTAPLLCCSSCLRLEINVCVWFKWTLDNGCVCVHNISPGLVRCWLVSSVFRYFIWLANKATPSTPPQPICHLPVCVQPWCASHQHIVGDPSSLPAEMTPGRSSGVSSPSEV